jgi:subtilisin-like proprotein convertase family protein
MKIKILAENLTNETAATQKRIENVPCVQPQNSITTMKILKAKILLVLLAAVSPLLLQAQTTESFTYTTNRLVPDGNASGLSDVRSVNSAVGTITSLKVRLKVTGEFNGDLYGYVRHSSGFTVLLNRPGKTAGDPYGYGDSGFNVTFQNGAINGDLHVYQSIAPPADGSPLTGIWQPDGRNVDPATVTDASVRSTSLTNFNGLNAAGEWTMYLVDLESGGTNMLTEWGIDITGAAYPTLTWSNPANIVYGTSLGAAQLNATAIYNGTNVPGTFAYSPATGTVLNAGLGQTLSVTFTPTDLTSFLPISTNVAINVIKAPLAIAAVDKTKIYGAALPTLTASYVGFTNGDTAASLDTAVTLDTTATASSPIGAYTITASGAADANYTITHINGTLTVTTAPLTIIAVDKSKVYGAALPTLTASYAGFVNSDDTNSLTTQATLSTTATASSPVGTYTIAASGAVGTNYSITHVSGSLIVTAGTITITADDKSKTYGQALPTFTAAYDGFVLGQSTNDLLSLPTLTTIATATSNVGTYPITASGAASTNYTFTYVEGTLTITQSLTSGAILSSANPALPGSNVTFTVTLNAVAPGAGTPSGIVDFRIDGSVAGSGTLSGGVAMFTTNNLALGAHTVASEYAGNLNFVGVTNSLTQNQVINTPPVAGNDTIQRMPTASVKVRLSTLLANDNDADSDPLSILVNLANTNGATITVSGGWVFYAPATGFTNADSFTYTITDGRGGSAIGTVTVAIQVDNTQSQNLTLTDLGNGSFLIRGNGIPGRTYHLQYSDSVSPFIWQELTGGSVTADSAGVFQVTDTPGVETMRFYRSVYP